ncbi:MAG: hypothetical protein IEMM0002_1168 [bacterium]|nr:MAG: hypothetical protein IEMM0002_1168 [bacterium]
MTGDEKLRSNRVVYYRDTIDRIDSLLKEFIRLSNAKSTFFIDRDGHLVTSVGASSKINPETLSALVAGSFAATKELARVMGESEFNSMSHKGEKGNINIVLVGRRSIVAILFDEKTTAGMISLYCRELVEKFAKILDVAERQQKLHSKESLHKDFQSSVQEKLDDLFED